MIQLVAAQSHHLDGGEVLNAGGGDFP